MESLSRRLVMSSKLELVLFLANRPSMASLKLAITPLVPDLVLGACLRVGMLISGSMSSSLSLGVSLSLFIGFLQYWLQVDIRWIQHHLLTEKQTTKMMKEIFKHRIVATRGKKLRQLVEHHLSRAKWSIFPLQDQKFGNITQGLRKIETSVYATTARTNSRVSQPQGHQIWRNILKYARTILLGQLDKRINTPLLMMMGN